MNEREISDIIERTRRRVGDPGTPLLARQAAKQTTFAFLEEHPVIRPMTDYAAVVAAAHQRLVIAKPVGEREQQREHVLHDRGRAVIAQVANGDAPCARRSEIHVVHAGRGQRDQPQLRIRRDHRARDDRLVGEHGLHAGDATGDLRGGRLRVQLDAGCDALERSGIEIAAADGAEVEKDGLQEGSFSNSSTSAVSSRFCSS